MDSYSFIKEDIALTKEEVNKKQLIKKLNEGSTFKLEFHFNKRKSRRNSFLLILLSTIIDAVIGIVFYYVLKLINTTNQYIILGIGCGIGAIFGLINGIIIILALRLDIVDEIGSGYGPGLGTNVFIGAIVGTLAGTLFGSLFGLILKALDLTLNFALDFDIELEYTVYGMLIWIVLGLNIGVLIGLITSFGLIDIVIGGAISGFIVGFIGMLAVFGFDIILLIGSITGSLVGCFIGVLIKYSIKASLGMIETPGIFSKCRSSDRLGNKFIREPEDPGKKRKESICNGGGWGSCDCGPSSGGSCDGGGDCGGAAVAILLVVLIAIPIILILMGVSWMSVKASQKFGQTVKKGALTAIGASISITTIIGSNLGLTSSYNILPLWKMVTIGGALGFTFGLLIVIAKSLSYKLNKLEISPSNISWKDKHSEGKISYSEILEYSFETRQKKLEIKETEECLNLHLKANKKKDVIIDCWIVPEEFNSTDYVKFIFDFYKKQQIENEKELLSTIDTMQTNNDYRLLHEDLAETDAITITDSFIDEEYPDMEIESYEIDEIGKLIEKQKKISASWISSVTKIPYAKVLVIVTRYFKDYTVDSIGNIKKL